MKHYCPLKRKRYKRNELLQICPGCDFPARHSCPGIVLFKESERQEYLALMNLDFILKRFTK